MKSMKLLCWITLASVSVLGACGGVSSIGSGDDPSKGGTSSTAGSGKGAENTGATSMGAQSTGATGMGATGNIAGKDPGTGATGMGGTGMGGTECTSDMDCTDPVAPCEPCPDGTYACTRNTCVAGKCAHAQSVCSNNCMTDKDCPVPLVACTMCADGSSSCPTSQCIKGSCQTSIPGCGGYDPCKGLGCGAECKPCLDGMCDVANQLNYCNADGKCQPGVPQCADPTECKTVMDCGAPPPKCIPCGNDTCATFDCIKGSCVFACPPNPNPQCKTSEECPVIGDQCKMCQSGKCAVNACLQGSCELVCPL